jgi:hypothetical protein
MDIMDHWPHYIKGKSNLHLDILLHGTQYNGWAGCKNGYLRLMKEQQARLYGK